VSAAILGALPAADTAVASRFATGPGMRGLSDAPLAAVDNECDQDDSQSGHHLGNRASETTAASARRWVRPFADVRGWGPAYGHVNFIVNGALRSVRALCRIRSETRAGPDR